MAAEVLLRNEESQPHSKLTQKYQEESPHDLVVKMSSFSPCLKKGCCKPGVYLKDLAQCDSLTNTSPMRQSMGRILQRPATFREKLNYMASGGGLDGKLSQGLKYQQVPFFSC